MPKSASSPSGPKGKSALPPGNAVERWAPWALVTAVTLAYLSSFGGIFVFDDFVAIVENPTLREVWRLDRVLLLPGDEAGTVGGRPLANLTFALNHAISGTEPWSYHAFNLIVHVLAVLTLYAVLRRTFRQERISSCVGSGALALAWVSALLWGLHPLQTASVTYVVQRVESLAGLWYLLTLLCFIRAVDTPERLRWRVAAFGCCLAGMATKETVASAPLFFLLYDRAFFAASWREVWQRRGRFHGALMGTWLLLVLLVAGTAGRGGTAGFGVGVTSWSYLLTQSEAIMHYLRLAVWPHPLVFDHGTQLVARFTEVWWQMLLLTALVAATVWAAVRRPLLALPGAWFFLILAPSSSIVPVATQTMAEHRMYLPLAAVIVLLVLGAHAVLGRKAFVGFLVLAVAAGGMTAKRNTVYRSELALWGDTVLHRPDNARAHTNLGVALLAAGRPAEAVRHYEESLRLKPGDAATHLNLCAALIRLGRAGEALSHGEEALRLDPGSVNARVNLANALVQLGRFDEAIRHHEIVLQREPDDHDVRLTLAATYFQQGNFAAAVEHFGRATQLKPDRAQTWLELMRTHLQLGDDSAARRAGERALQLEPDFPDACYLLGNLAAKQGNFGAAIPYYRRALVRAPTFAAARNNLANALFASGQLNEAIVQYREVLRLNPGDRAAQENLAHALELQRSSLVR